MARPFQYDTYVKSQIGIDNDYDNINKSHLRSTIQKHEGPFYHPPTFENPQQISSRASLKNKINELLGLCQDENKQINGQFHDVMGAEGEILGLLKEQASRPPPSNTYVRSNVQNFPGSSNGLPGHKGYNFDHDQTPNDKASFLKSKVQDLLEENKYLKYQASQVAHPEEDQQIRYLQDEIQRLRQLLPRYQSEISRLRQNGGGSYGSGSRVLDLLEQGERIRQDTISLLRSNEGGSYQNGSSQNRILAELDQLRGTYKNLEEQNARLKRASKGSDYTSQSRKYY